MNKKILIVIARLNIGGTTKYIYELQKGLAEKGFSILIATGHVEDDEVEDKLIKEMPIIRVKHLYRSLNLVKDLMARRNLKKIIKDFSPNLIYSHTFKAGLLTRTIFSGAPIIHAHHGHSLTTPEFKGVKRIFWIFIERFLACRCEYIVTVGKQVTIDLLNARIGTANQYTSIPPGIVPISLVERSKSIELLNLEDNDSVKVAWLGRFTEVKNPHMVLSLASEFPHVDFIMGGSGDLFDEIVKAKPSNLYAVGWKNSNLILGGSDILINTSHSEGMSVALIEAQQSGLPVVATAVGATNEVVLHGETGFISGIDLKEFSQYLSILINDVKLRLTMGSNAKHFALYEFSVQNLIVRHIELFKKIIE